MKITALRGGGVPVKLKGTSRLTILAWLLIFTALLSLGLKVGPLYIENALINRAVATAAKPGLTDLSAPEIRARLSRYFQMNNLNIDPREFKIARTPDTLTLTRTYEERIHLIANIDLVLTFTNRHQTD